MLRELILTTYLFDGYPTALEGFKILQEFESSFDITGDSLPYTPENIVSWRKRGDQLCRCVYGSQFEPLMNNVRNFAPELLDAMIVEGYGKVLSRDNLDIRLRELCVVAMLAYKCRYRQLLSHALGSLRLGVLPDHLRSAGGIASRVMTKRKSAQAMTVIEKAIRLLTAP